MQQGFGFFTWFAFFLGKLPLNATHQSKVEVKTYHSKTSSTENKFSNSDRKFLFESNNSIIKLLIPS